MEQDKQQRKYKMKFIPHYKDAPSSLRNGQDIWVRKGTPVICSATNDEYDLNNGEQFEVEDWSEEKNTITLKTVLESTELIELPLELFPRIFRPAFCITIHASQGATFNFPYTIYEWEHERMSTRAKYVAITRGTTTAHINIKNKPSFLE